MSSLFPVRVLHRLRESFSSTIVRKKTINLTQDYATITVKVKLKADRELADDKVFDTLCKQITDSTRTLARIVDNSPTEEDYTYTHHDVFTNDPGLSEGLVLVRVKIAITAPSRDVDAPLKEYELDEKVDPLVEDDIFDAARKFVDA